MVIEMNDKKNIIKNILSSLIQQFIALFYGFIIPILLIQNYGSKVNGLISSIEQFLSYIVLLEFGIGPVIKATLFKPLSKRNQSQLEMILNSVNKFFKKIAYIFIIYILFLILIYPEFIKEFDKLYVISLIIIISIGRFFEYFIGMTYKIFLQADQKNYIVDNIISITYLLNLIILYLIIKLGFSIQIVKVASSLIYLLRPLFLKIYFDMKYAYKFNKNSKYSLPQRWDGLFHHVASVIQSNTDIVILTIFSSLESVSIYSVYALVITGVRGIIVAFTNGIDAYFGKLLALNEKENLNRNFQIYSFFFYTITTIIMICTFILILPFVNIYTKGISDANYNQPMFAMILVLSEFMYVIRYPYSSIVYANGHFKQTKTFSIVEPIVNIIVSFILVIKFGLVGVAIGTLISMPIRSFGFIIYGSRKILKNGLIRNLKFIFISITEFLIISFISLFILNIKVNNYVNFMLYAIIIFLIISFIIIILNCIIYKKILFRIKGRNKNDE